MASKHTSPSNWPPHFKALWDDVAQRHNLDPQRPTDSIWEMHNRLADETARQLAMITVKTSDLTREWQAEDQALTSARTLKPITCDACGAGNLNHFYTSKNRDKTLCEACFQEGVGSEQATEPDLSQH